MLQYTTWSRTLVSPHSIAWIELSWRIYFATSLTATRGCLTVRTSWQNQHSRVASELHWRGSSPRLKDGRTVFSISFNLFTPFTSTCESEKKQANLILLCHNILRQQWWCITSQCREISKEIFPVFSTIERIDWIFFFFF